MKKSIASFILLVVFCGGAFGKASDPPPAWLPWTAYTPDQKALFTVAYVAGRIGGEKTMSYAVCKEEPAGPTCKRVLKDFPWLENEPQGDVVELEILHFLNQLYSDENNLDISIPDATNLIYLSAMFGYGKEKYPKLIQILRSEYDR